MNASRLFHKPVNFTSYSTSQQVYLLSKLMPEDSGRWLIGEGKLNFFTTALVQLFQTRCKISLGISHDLSPGWVRGGGGCRTLGDHMVYGENRGLVVVFS